MDYEETAVIVEMEIENFNNLNKFGRLIISVTFYNLRQCQHIICSNCTFIDNFHDEENAVNNLKNFCREHFGDFLSLICLLKCLAEKKQKKTKKPYIKYMKCK